MSERDEEPGTRAAFHQQHQAGATALAESLLARRETMQGAWLNWVAVQLYQLSPPPMPPWCGENCSASPSSEAGGTHLPRCLPLLISSGTVSLAMRLRNSAARASSSVVTGTVMDSRMGISQACSTGLCLSHEK